LNRLQKLRALFDTWNVGTLYCTPSFLSAVSELHITVCGVVIVLYKILYPCVTAVMAEQRLKAAVCLRSTVRAIKLMAGAIPVQCRLQPASPTAVR